MNASPYARFLMRGLRQKLIETAENLELNGIEAIEQGEQLNLQSLDNHQKQHLEDLHDNFYSHLVCPFIISLWGDRGWCQDLAKKHGFRLK